MLKNLVNQRQSIKKIKINQSRQTTINLINHHSTSFSTSSTSFQPTTLIFTQSKLRSLSPRLVNPLSSLFNSRSIFIQTETTPNPDALKFIPGVPVMGKSNGTLEFLSNSNPNSSPLAKSLFKIPGIKSLFFGPDFISINKDEETNWSIIKPEIYSLMMEFFSSGQPILTDESEGNQGPEDTRVLESDSEVIAMIKELLDTRVRPSIQEDGGDLEYKGFDEETGVVTLMLKGSCRGCDSSTVTLKSGIERMLMHYIPEVQAVEQVLSEEEKVANDEFSKFEERLRSGGKTVSI
ncbi:uncharacterized protein MELLADRAFT_41822 [Melampsora larici-populina 98AG31]|uniref:Scaffold protein Nfu/NifU N-terminal domain-containing protein n=1 Tax=Melampsora larici-populina (strain 98AG31 / pathotype 3-4-7) TaxID=747676 RepID=F4R7A4_MELLP|nr:uncharacterized protein MELLADRAFT_41822 [Melampsora larici-populina 98AG31]EGG11278.1 hypothetical protein MELLADRAFT_41822 [Melampsora larici-populina 98AG31]